MSPFFTIATISYNSEAWINDAIQSVLASTYADFEYLISDDSSTDNSWEVIQTYTDPRIRAWKNEKNIGEYPNRNKVLSEAKGKFIFYIDGDDILYKDTLKTLHNYLRCFPNVGAVWGIPVREIQFAVLPYVFNSEQVLQLIYRSNIRIFSLIGFAETVFNTQCLRDNNGFNFTYAIGDTYIKRKLALHADVLMIPEGLSYWRRSNNQASKKVSKNYRSFIDLHQINAEVLNDPNLPLTSGDKKEAMRNVRISEVKLLIANTLMKGRFKDFFWLSRKINLKISDLKLVLAKGSYYYSPINDISKPLTNQYNFTRQKALSLPQKA
jgi:glycosyltransferase involved in cell wall biosynthesis